jgi:hypothetical protein
LEKHIKKDRKNILESSAKLVNLYYNFFKTSGIIFTKYCELALVPVSNWGNELDQKPRIRVQAANKFLNDSENVNSLDLSYDGNFKVDSNACWNTLADLRAASVFSMCSGRASIFFHQQKGLITEQYCEKSLASCYKVLKTTGRLINLIHWMINRDEDRTAGIYPTFANGVDFSSVKHPKEGKKSFKGWKRFKERKGLEQTKTLKGWKIFKGRNRLKDRKGLKGWKKKTKISGKIIAKIRLLKHVTTSSS